MPGLCSRAHGRSFVSTNHEPPSGESDMASGHVGRSATSSPTCAHFGRWVGSPEAGAFTCGSSGPGPVDGLPHLLPREGSVGTGEKAEGVAPLFMRTAGEFENWPRVRFTVPKPYPPNFRR